MAERIKRPSQPPKRLLNEYLPNPDTKKRKKAVKDNRLYEIEIVEIDNNENKVKILYKGFGEEADEWRDMPKGQKFPFVRLEKAYVPSNKSLEDRMQSFHERVYHEIKRRLWSGRRDDPDIRIEISVDSDVFNHGIGRLVKGVRSRGKIVYSIRDNSDLNNFLGERRRNKTRTNKTRQEKT